MIMMISNGTALRDAFAAIKDLKDPMFYLVQQSPTWPGQLAETLAPKWPRPRDPSAKMARTPDPREPRVLVCVGGSNVFHAAWVARGGQKRRELGCQGWRLVD